MLRWNAPSARLLLALGIAFAAFSCTFVPERAWQESRELSRSGEQELARGRAAEAESRLLAALALRETYFGAGDDIAARLEDGIGAARLARGEPAAAEQNFRRSLAVYVAFDCVNADRARGVLHLVEALLRQERAPEAAHLVAAERDLAAGRLPPEDAAHLWLDIAWAVSAVAPASLGVARWGVEEAAHGLFAGGSPADAAWGFYVAGILAHAAGDPRAAAETLEEAFRLSLEHRGPVHPLTLACQAARARAWAAALSEPGAPATEAGPRRSKWEEFLALLEPGRDADWRLRNLENLLDDPVDDVKHRLHGMRIGAYRMFLPGAWMHGSGNPCP
ncbi:MAG: tetratricopeptide repeat protein [Desulfobacterales bacterium]